MKTDLMMMHCSRNQPFRLFAIRNSMAFKKENVLARYISLFKTTVTYLESKTVGDYAGKNKKNKQM